MIEREHLTPVNGYKIDVSVVEPHHPPKANALFLHGAGESTKHRLLPLARELGKLGYRGVVFSFPGHGESSGTLLGSTLNERLEVAKEISKQFGTFPADMVVAVSMGGHTAMSMLEIFGDRIERLALLAPAAYSREAEEVPFGPGFTEVIRQPKSYTSSKVWDILPSYKGQLVTFEAELDAVIPTDIFDLIHANATNASQKEHVVIPGVDHRLTNWVAEDSARLEAMAKALDTFDFSGLDSVF